MYNLIVGATGQMKRHFITELSDVLFYVHKLSIESCYHWVQAVLETEQPTLVRVTLQQKAEFLEQFRTSVSAALASCTQTASCWVLRDRSSFPTHSDFRTRTRRLTRRPPRSAALLLFSFPGRTSQGRHFVNRCSNRFSGWHSRVKRMTTTCARAARRSMGPLQWADYTGHCEKEISHGLLNIPERAPGRGESKVCVLVRVRTW